MQSRPNAARRCPSAHGCDAVRRSIQPAKLVFAWKPRRPDSERRCPAVWSASSVRRNSLVLLASGRINRRFSVLHGTPRRRFLAMPSRSARPLGGPATLRFRGPREPGRVRATLGLNRFVPVASISGPNPNRANGCCPGRGAWLASAWSERGASVPLMARGRNDTIARRSGGARARRPTRAAPSGNWLRGE
jgi:hypothetical protein